MTQLGRPDRSGLRERNHLRSATLLLTACALTAVAACTSAHPQDEKPEKASPAASTSHSPKSADPTAVAETAAVSVYKQYWQEMERLYADSSGKNTHLKRYAAGVALVSAENDAKQMHDKGNLILGTVTVDSPTVTASDIGRKVPKVVVTSCLNVSKWQVVDSATKKPVPLPSTRLTKYVVVSTLEQWPEGWRVVKDEPQGKSC